MTNQPDHPAPRRRPKKTESEVEVIKRESRGLRGTLADTLASDATHFSEAEYQLLKFHGIYQQDDRDSRSARQDASQEPDYSFMIRVAIPGGRLTADQYLALDDLADTCGNHTLRITTRQGIQYHRVPKDDLKALIAGVNAKLMTTLSACGDVNRNVMASPAPLADPAHQLVQRLAVDIAKDLRPTTSAYHEIWLAGEKIHSTEPPDPLYGEQYLPRKFKVGIALATDNSIDVYSYDAGLIVVVEDGHVVGFQVTAGGGFGMTHNKANTIATLAKPVGFIAPQHAVAAVRLIAEIFRDHGDRINRKQARLKYIIRDKGIEWFRDEYRKRADFNVAPPRDLPRPAFHDYLGRHPQGDGKDFYGVFVENGRVADVNGTRIRTALREIATELQPSVVLTPNQNLLFTDLAEGQVARLEEILAQHGVRRVSELSNARRYSMACPALPTCGLALTESERVLPDLVDRFAETLATLGLQDEKLTIRMTGCPNGCARPYTADLGFVGRKPGERYNIYVGGDLAGDRMSELYAEDVHIDELVDAVRPLLAAFAAQRLPDESFSDYYLRLTGRDRPNDTVTGADEPLRDKLTLPLLPTSPPAQGGAGEG